MTSRYGWIGLLLALLLSACQPEETEDPSFVIVQSQGTERTFIINNPVTVEDFLAQVDDITWDENDRIVPPLYTQVTDGTRITIVSVEEEERCETEPIPFETVTQPNEAFQPGETRVQRRGQSGEQQVCYRIIYEDGVQQQRLQIGQPEILIEPVSEIRIVGITQEVEPTPITGTLAYLNNSNAWVVTRSSREKRALTVTSDLDSLVFSLSPDGRHLLFTREAEDSEAFVNELWLVDTRDPDSAVQLSPTDVLDAEWVPSETNTISYSTSEVHSLSPGWNAFNNLWISTIDTETGELFNPRLIVDENSGGAYGWWGTVFAWSPDGERLAWSQAEAIGIYDDTNRQQPLLQFASFRNMQDWSWRADISWSWEGDLLATVVHGPPQAGEPADTSPIFNVVVTDSNGTFEALIHEGAGMWANPKFSPELRKEDTPFPQGYLAYLRARDPNQPVFGEYDLVVADRDGSNSRVVFPDPALPGIKSSDFGLSPQDFAWSPDGRQIAVTYQGNLYVVDVQSGASYQLTFDGNSEHPVWSP